MKSMRFSFVALVLCALFAAPAVMAEEIVPTTTAEEAVPAAEEMVIPVLQTEDGLPIEMSASGKNAPNLRSNSMRATGEEAVACDWFSISCSNGSSDRCCGSVNSCLGYCGEVCGEPCVYQE